MSEEEQREAYCKKHNIHHLLELLATKVLVNRPENPFEYLRNVLSEVEQSEANKVVYDPTDIKFNHPDTAASTQDENGEQQKQQPKKVTLITLGLNNAGKTSILSALGGEITTSTTPTVGFTPVHFQTDEYDICMFDLGGAANFRGVWTHYFQDCHGLMYVIDSASSDVELVESLETLTSVLEHPLMAGKPVLVISNKKDLPDSRLLNVVPPGFLQRVLQPGTPHQIICTSAVEEDEERDEQVEWLLQRVADNYESLSARVKHDVAQAKEEKRIAREARLKALQEEE